MDKWEDGKIYDFAGLIATGNKSTEDQLEIEGNSCYPGFGYPLREPLTKPSFYR